MKINSTIIKLFLLVLMPAGIIFSTSAKIPKNKGKNIALSITGKNPKKQKINYLNLGIMSNYTYLEGASINLLSDFSTFSAKGFQLSGFVNITGYKSYGIQMSGLANISGYKASGLRLGGLMNISGNSFNGFQLSGLGNIAGKSQNGVSISGLINMNSKESSGLQISGLSNIIGENQKGVSVSGLMNVSGGSMKGVQVSSLLNIAGKTNYGLQLSALGNINIRNTGVQFSGLSNFSSKNEGAQIGITNISGTSAKGVQFGIINISNDSCNISRQIGLINIKPTTRTQLIVSSGNINKASVAVRFKNRMLYTQFGAGLIAGEITDNTSISVTYRTGLSLPIIKDKFNINTDIGYSHIETLNNKGIPDRLYSIQPRIGLEYSFNKKIGFFAAGGYSWTRTYKWNKAFSNNPMFELGIILF